MISGSGQVGVVANSPTNQLALTGTNTYTGLTTITQGVLDIGNGGTTGSVAGNISVSSNLGALVFLHSNALTYAGLISGAGSVAQKGSGVLTLSGNNTYSGGTSIVGGTLVMTNLHAAGAGEIDLGQGGELRASSSFILNEPVFLVSATNATISATAGSTLTLQFLGLSGTTGITFGSAGNTGTVALASTVSEPSPVAVTVAFGTLLNMGSVGSLGSHALSLTSSMPAPPSTSTTSTARSPISKAPAPFSSARTSPPC